jgi:phosphoserine phosphatase
MDGTLIPGTTADLHYAELLGESDQVMALERAYRAGEMSSRRMSEELARCLAGLTAPRIEEGFDSLPRVQGIGDTVAELRRHGLLAIVVTASNVLYARCFQRAFGFHAVFGSRHEVFADGRIGVARQTCDGAEKVRCVERFAGRRGWSLDRVVAVGDSASDLALFAAVGLSIAFNGDSEAVHAADRAVEGTDARLLLPVILERAS